MVSAKGSGKVGGVTVAHLTRDLVDRNRLLGQELRGDSHTPRHEVAMESSLPELGIGALQLARGGAQCPRHRRNGQLPSVVADDDDPRKQIETTSFTECVDTHTPLADDLPAPGQQRKNAARANATPLDTTSAGVAGTGPQRGRLG
jgi:hypothetical protein